MDAPVGPMAVIFGSEGVIEVPQPFHPRKDAHLLVRRLGERPTIADREERVPFDDGRHPFTSAIEHFHACIVDGSQPSVSPLNAIGTLRVIEAMLESSGTGRRVDL